MATITDQRKGASAGPTRTPPKGGDAKDGKDEGTAEKAKGGKKVILIAIVALVLLAAAGGGAYFFFLKKPGPPPPPVGGAMVQMDPMTLSLSEGHFLKVQIAIQLVEGKATAETFQTVQASQILIDTFSNRGVAELTTNKARKALTAQVLAALKKAYPKEVFDVFLTQFVIQ
jgi:flagellar FliL protein